MFIAGFLERLVCNANTPSEYIIDEINRIASIYSYDAVAKSNFAVLLKSGPHYLGNSAFSAVSVINIFENASASNKNVKNISITNVMYNMDNVSYYRKLISYIYDALSPIAHFEAKRSISDNIEYISKSMSIRDDILNKVRDVFQKNSNATDVGFRLIDSTQNRFTNIAINLLPIEYKDKIIERISLFLDKFFKYEEEGDTAQDIDEADLGLDDFISDELCSLFVNGNKDSYIYSVSSFSLQRYG